MSSPVRPAAGHAGLPVPGPDALAHSEALRQQIATRIRTAGGLIGFDEYMDLALYAPGLGYYSAGARKFGPAGDFVTAPELSPLFGQTLAGWCARSLQALGGGDLLEIGAGSGALAADLLASWPGSVPLPHHYLILEVSADLRERQRARLKARVPALLERVRWLDAWPAPLTGVIRANEVLDALPVRRFRRSGGALVELGVGLCGEGFGWAERPAGPALVAAVAAIDAGLDAPLPAGYIGETCPRLPGFIAGLADSLAQGAALLLDYGCSRREYYHPQQSTGRLACHYRHRAHADPFLYPGLQDITAWVDFSAVASAASASGLSVAGYATQASFLVAAGIEDRFAAAVASGGRAALEAAQQARALLLPGEMGETVKAMMLVREGFIGDHESGGRDLRHLL